MSESKPPFLTRLALAWRTLTDAAFAAEVSRLSQGALTTEVPEPAVEKPTPFLAAAPDSALQLLGLLQQEGRLVDFLEEDVGGFADAEIGGAARVVHEGCRKVLREHLHIEPVSDKQEGDRLTLEQGFDAAAFRLTGNVVGTAPFSGTLAHRGWRATEVKLPKIAAGHDASVIAPAEVEL